MIYPKFLPDDPGYGRFKRAKFQVVAGAQTMIDLSPFSGVDYCSARGDRLIDLSPTHLVSSKPRELPLPHYDSYTVPQANGEPLDLVVDFCKREKKGELIVYKSVAVSYNDITLYADAISLRPRDLLLQLTAGRGTLISAGKSKEVTKLSSFIGRKTVIDLTPGFTESVKVKSNVQSKSISFSLVIQRGGRSTVFYEDRQKGITLRWEGENVSSLTAESPNRIKLNGYGSIVSNKLAPFKAGSYSNFTITINTYGSGRFQRAASFSIDIPNAKGYHASGVIPQRSIQIRRESTPPSVELADSVKE